MWLELHSGAHFYTSAISAKIVPKTAQNAQDASQSASRWPDNPHLGPSWRQLGRILAPSSVILLPFWASRACPKSAQIGQDSLLAIFLPKVAPKSSQTPSKPRCFRFQGRFFKLSGQIFVGFSLPVSTFLHGLLKGADRKGQAGKKGAGGTRRRRLRYPPPPRSGEPGVFKSGVQSCQFQFSNSTNWFQGGLAPVARGPAARVPSAVKNFFRLKLAILGHLRPTFSQHLAKKLPT